MSKQQGFAGKAINAAHHLAAVKNIIKAFLQGGWASAALQTLKYYWPQILTIAVALVLLPVIIISCLPMVMFGYENSKDAEITEMTAQANMVGSYFDNYDKYCEECMNQINTEIKVYADAGFPIIRMGESISKNWFIALFSVSVGNNLTGVTEQQIIDFVNSLIVYEVTEVRDDESKWTSYTVIVKYLSVEETMEYLKFSDSDKNWATLIFNTLESEESNGNNSTYT